MNRYAIYCSEEQTKKALALGAPIETYKPIIINSKAGGSFTTPTIETITAEQMIGWLDENGVTANIIPNYVGVNPISTQYRFAINVRSKIIDSIEFYPSHKEATIAAIDAALDYLIKTNEE